MRYNLQLANTKSAAICSLLAVLLLSESCRKEKELAPSDLDENYFVVKDNPNDPADHAIYQFYKSTGIACFYNDTIQQKKVADTSGVPVYAYVTLSLNYTPFGSTYVQFKRLSSKSSIPALLDLLKNELVHRLPADLSIPSIWLLDSILYKAYPVEEGRVTDGWTSVQGFNTVGIMVQDVGIMNEEEQKMYAASILAGIAVKRLNQLYAGRLQKDFFSITRTKANAMVPGDIYYGLPMWTLFPNLNFPRPEEFGFLRYNIVYFFGPNDYIHKISPPNEIDDLRIYLAHILYYSEQHLSEKYLNDALVLKKISVIREMVREAGFRLPD